MDEDAKSDEVLLRYALGRLSEQQHEAVEQRIFADPEFFGRLQAVEDDLIDSYASGKLTGDDRDRFEKYLLQGSEDSNRIDFSRALTSVVSNRAKAAKPAAATRRLSSLSEFVRNRLIIVPLAASLLLAAACVWLVVETSRLSNRVEQYRAEKSDEEKQIQQLAQHLADERQHSLDLTLELEKERDKATTETPKSSLGSLASFVLTLGAARGTGATTKLTIPAEAKQVRLDAVFDTGDFHRYRAEIQNVDGRVLWSRTGLTSRARGSQRMVSIVVPAQTLRDEDYILALSGLTAGGDQEIVGEYFFRVLADKNKK